MKKLLALLLTGCMMATALVGCGAKEEVAEADATVVEEADATDVETTEAESDLAYVTEKIRKNCTYFTKMLLYMRFFV